MAAQPASSTDDLKKARQAFELGLRKLNFFNAPESAIKQEASDPYRSVSEIIDKVFPETVGDAADGPVDFNLFGKFQIDLSQRLARPDVISIEQAWRLVELCLLNWDPKINERFPSGESQSQRTALERAKEILDTLHQDAVKSVFDVLWLMGKNANKSQVAFQSITFIFQMDVSLRSGAGISKHPPFIPEYVADAWWVPLLEQIQLQWSKFEAWNSKQKFGVFAIALGVIAVLAFAVLNFFSFGIPALLLLGMSIGLGVFSVGAAGVGAAAMAPPTQAPAVEPAGFSAPNANPPRLSVGSIQYEDGSLSDNGAVSPLSPSLDSQPIHHENSDDEDGATPWQRSAGRYRNSR
jgi:hypothetical protein